MTMSNDFAHKDISQITTYQSGVAQATAFRVINRQVADFLLSYGLTRMQWYVVGLARDAGSGGIRVSDLARKLNTTVPYITNLIASLETRGIIQKLRHQGDSRIKLISIVDSYLPTVNQIETDLREHLREQLYGEHHITRQELSDYIHVLYKIIDTK